MKDINKEEFSDFEKSWQNAFDKAEMPVENDIWSNLDAHLANKDTERYKRKIVFYKWVAAASVVFAVGLSYFTYNINIRPLDATAFDTIKTPSLALENESINERLPFALDEDNENLAEETEDILTQGLSEQRSAVKPNNRITNNQELASNANDNEKSNEDKLLITKRTERSQSVNVEDQAIYLSENDEKQGVFITDGPVIASDSENMGALEVDGPSKAAIPGSSNSNNNEPALAGIDIKSGKPLDLKYYAQLLDPPYIYAIPGISIEREEKSGKERKILWAGLNIGSGVFDPNFENGSNFQPKTSPALSQTFAREAPQAASFKENTNAGITYSLGLNFGVRITEKWVIQSGIQYAHKNASTSNTTYLRNNIDDKMKPTYLGEEKNDMINATSATFSQEYDLMNSFEFASIPVKAGYLLIDRKVGLMLTAGVGTDIFLSNTISESNNKLDDVKKEAGSESPFREISFNGLFGAEVFYAISRQYHLTLEPNYSIALSPLTKTGEAFKSHPQTFGLTAGLKYYWK